MNTILASGGNPLKLLNELGVEWNFLAGQIFSFALMATVIYIFVFKPVIKATEERQKKIQKGLLDAESASKSLETAHIDAAGKIRKAAEDAAGIVAEARTGARALVEKAREESRKTAEDMLKAAEMRISEEKAQMREELKSEMAALIAKAARQAIGEALDEEQKSKIAQAAALNISKQG